MFNIRLNFSSPECTPRFWPLEFLAFMAVPKAAVHKHNRLVFPQNNVRLSWQRLVMQAKPEACGVKRFSDDDLRFGILAFDTSHHAAARGFVYNVNQLLFLLAWV
jgi:hypothetical protein